MINAKTHARRPPQARRLYLQSADLLDDGRPVEHGGLLGGVGAQAAHEVGLRVHQRPQEVVEARVEVLRERRHRLVAVLAAGRGAESGIGTWIRCYVLLVVVIMLKNNLFFLIHCYYHHCQFNNRQ